MSKTKNPIIKRPLSEPGVAGVEFVLNGRVLQIETGGALARIYVTEDGDTTMIEMPTAVLEGVLRSALDSMGSAARARRVRQEGSPLCRPKACDISPAGVGGERGAA